MKFSGTEIERIVTRYGRMYVPKADSVIGRSLRIYGEWAEHEIACISECIHADGAILDIGGNIGTHMIALAHRHPDSHIVAFEPGALAFSLMSASAVFNGVDNVSLFNVGCASESGVRFLNMDYSAVDWNYGAASFVGRDAETGVVTPFSFAPLDSFTFDRKIVLVKIDVEGMELDVLRGAVGHLGRDRPYVFFEVLDLEAGFGCRDFLKTLGYSFYWVSTSAFNPDNFNQHSENVWMHGELSMLAVPAGQPVPSYLTPQHEVSEAQINASADELRDALILPVVRP